MVRKVLPLVLVAAAVVSGCAGTGGQSQTHAIYVTGTGTAKLAPDIVLITLGVQTQGPDIAEAVQENNQRAGEVMAAIRQAGVADADMSTANFSVSTQQQYDDHGNPTGEVSYWVDNSVNVTLRDLGKLGELLQSALTHGANSVQSVTYSVEDPTDALDAARVQALEDAHNQAEQMAAAAGVELGQVLTVGEPGVTPGTTTAFAPAFGKGGGGGVPTTPGTLEYTVELSVVYSIP
jgi:uncharacterized protein YggE